MDSHSPNEYLESHVHRVKTNIVDGSKRIIAHYDANFDAPDGYPPFDETSPHEILIERAIKIIAFTEVDLVDEWIVFDSPEDLVQIPLFGIAIESLLNGAHIVIDETDYVDSIKNNRHWNTPGFAESKKVVLEDLKSKLPTEEYERAELFLDLMQSHRNNEVHLGFHRLQGRFLRRMVLEFSLRIGQHYHPGDIPRKDDIRSKISDLHMAEAGISSQIRFDPEGQLED